MKAMSSPDPGAAAKTDLERQLKSQLSRRNTQIEMLKVRIDARSPKQLSVAGTERCC